VGELIGPENSLAPKSPLRPVVTIGQLEIRRAAEALENELGKKWMPPLGESGCWLARLACTLGAPAGWRSPRHSKRWRCAHAARTRAPTRRTS
jgi:hypothetical protein